MGIAEVDTIGADIDAGRVDEVGGDVVILVHGD